MLPAAASFKKQGANRGALASFLVSTPESGVDSIAITYALLDPIMTVARPVAAFLSGISAGFLENSITRDYTESGSTEKSDGLRVISVPEESDKNRSFGKKTLLGIRYGINEVWADIALWFFVGLLLAGAITVMVPDKLFDLVLGGGILSMLAMLLLGLPVYICATASTPVAAALLIKGASPGAVLVFLLVGPATNMTSLSVLVRILGKMGTLRYLLVICLVSILLGLGLDSLYLNLGIAPRAIITEVQETIPHWLKICSAALLIALSVMQFYKWYRKKTSTAKQPYYFSGFPEVHAGMHHMDGRNKVAVSSKNTHHSRRIR